MLRPLILSEHSLSVCNCDCVPPSEDLLSVVSTMGAGSGGEEGGRGEEGPQCMR